jgi:hypothetical protein
MEQLAPRDQSLKRHEASSWAPLQRSVCDDVSSYDVWFLFGRLLLPPRIDRDWRVFAQTPLITGSCSPWPPKQSRPMPAAGAFMFDSYVIETRKGAAGIVVRDGRGFRFFAATRDFTSLEGKLFGTPKEAEAAAVRHVDGVKPQGRAPQRHDLAMQWSS